jgi:group II intron reverse transcriptase/maturase
MIDYYETKAHPITKKMVLDAYKEIKGNGKAAGVDGVSLDDYAKNLPGNLYKLWNRMTSGAYFPGMVREKQIPKKDGGNRSLGICNVEDRIAQQVVRKRLEHKIDPTFHPDSYGYRPGRHAHQAIKTATSRCFKNNWVIDLDVKAFFDTIDHELLMKAVKRYTEEKWVLMYIERWLKAGVLRENGTIERKEEGTLQGSVLSPLLANVFMHFVFDKWMEKNYPSIPFERYCDDVIVHCKSEAQAMYMKGKISGRMNACKLYLSPQKTKIVFCKNPNNKMIQTKQPTSFDFLGYSFRPRLVPTKNGILLLTLPTMSQKSKNKVMEKIREMKIFKRPATLQVLAKQINERTRGWINYYGAFNKWGTQSVWVLLNKILFKWVKRQREWNLKRAIRWFEQVYKDQPGLFVHWAIAHP